jgi:hypothetical protein
MNLCRYRKKATRLCPCDVLREIQERLLEVRAKSRNAASHSKYTDARESLYVTLLEVLAPTSVARHRSSWKELKDLPLREIDTRLEALGRAIDECIDTVAYQAADTVRTECACDAKRQKNEPPPRGLICLMARLAGEAMSRARRLEWMGKQLLPPDSVTQNRIHEEVLLLNSQVAHIRRELERNNCELVTCINSHEAYFDEEPCPVGEGYLPQDGGVVLPAVLHDGRLMIRGRLVRLTE